MRAAIIPARGGSKRIARKNIRMFHGKPIIAYSIETALQSDLFAVVVVSTEDEEIGKIAMDYGAAVIARPNDLAEINAPDPGTQEVTRHALDKMLLYGSDIDYACCIYATAPMLKISDLRIACDDLEASHDMPYVYLDGQFYLGRADAFMNRVPLANGWRLESSGPAIDINTEDDWQRMEEVYANHRALVRPGG